MSLCRPITSKRSVAAVYALSVKPHVDPFITGTDIDVLDTSSPTPPRYSTSRAVSGEPRGGSTRSAIDVCCTTALTNASASSRDSRSFTKSTTPADLPRQHAVGSELGGPSQEFVHVAAVGGRSHGPPRRAVWAPYVPTPKRLPRRQPRRQATQRACRRRRHRSRALCHGQETGSLASARRATVGFGESARSDLFARIPHADAQVRSNTSPSSVNQSP